MISAALSLVTKLLKEALASDPANHNYLKTLGVIKMQIETLSPSCQLDIDIIDGNVTVIETPESSSKPSTTAPIPADIRIQGKATDLLKLLSTPATDAAALRRANVRIDGDVALLLELSQTLEKIDIDWVAMLADTLGETPAVVLAKIARHSKEVLDTGKSHAQSWTQEWLRKPNSSAVTQEEGQALRSKARDLNYRLDRLEAKIAALSPSNLTSN